KALGGLPSRRSTTSRPTSLVAPGMANPRCRRGGTLAHLSLGPQKHFSFRELPRRSQRLVDGLVGIRRKERCHHRPTRKFLPARARQTSPLLPPVGQQLAAPCRISWRLPWQGRQLLSRRLVEPKQSYARTTARMRTRKLLPTTNL